MYPQCWPTCEPCGIQLANCLLHQTVLGIFTSWISPVGVACATSQTCGISSSCAECRLLICHKRGGLVEFGHDVQKKRNCEVISVFLVSLCWCILRCIATLGLFIRGILDWVYHLPVSCQETFWCIFWLAGSDPMFNLSLSGSRSALWCSWTSKSVKFPSLAVYVYACNCIYVYAIKNNSGKVCSLLSWSAKCWFLTWCWCWCCTLYFSASFVFLCFL